MNINIPETEFTQEDKIQLLFDTSLWLNTNLLPNARLRVVIGKWMTSLPAILLTLTFTICVNYSIAQVSDETMRQKVLEKAFIDSTIIFGKWTEKGGTETHLKYLGQVTTRRGQTVKIVNSSYFWGLSRRATSNILVFNDRNHYIGNYYVTMVTDLPTKMENGKLIFKNTSENCDKNLTTVLDLKRGLPKHFFRKCKGKYGDIYSFDTE